MFRTKPTDKQWTFTKFHLSTINFWPLLEFCQQQKKKTGEIYVYMYLTIWSHIHMTKNWNLFTNLKIKGLIYTRNFLTPLWF